MNRKEIQKAADELIQGAEVLRGPDGQRQILINAIALIKALAKLPAPEPPVRATVDEVREYAESKNLVIDPEAFVDHYKANGWKVGGKSPMKDWQAAVRNWARNGFVRDGQKSNTEVPF